MAEKALVITVTSNKGGVGKTTTCAALCDILRRKYQVLLIDTDPQGNCAGKFGLNVPEDEGNLGKALIDRIGPNTKWKPVSDYIIVNDDAVTAAAELTAIITAEHCRAADRMEYLEEI